MARNEFCQLARNIKNAAEFALLGLEAIKELVANEGFQTLKDALTVLVERTDESYGEADAKARLDTILATGTVECKMTELTRLTTFKTMVKLQTI